jgi:hypothetical protein
MLALPVGAMAMLWAALWLDGAPANAERGIGLRLDVDPQVALGIGDFCEQGSDYLACSPIRGALGFRGAVGFAPTPALSVGIGGGYFWLPDDSKGVDSVSATTTTFPKRMRHLFATGRHHPTPGTWIECDVGAVQMVDGIRTTGAVESYESVSVWGALLGVRAGYQWSPSRHFAPAIGAAATVTLLPSEVPSDTRGTRHSYGDPVWIGLFARASLIPLP